MKKFYELFYIKSINIHYKYAFCIQLVNIKGKDIIELRKKLLEQNILLIQVKTTYLRYFLKENINILNYKNNMYILYSNDLKRMYLNLNTLQNHSNILLFGLIDNKVKKKFTYAYLNYFLHKLRTYNKKQLQSLFVVNLKNHTMLNCISLLSLRKKIES